MRLASIESKEENEAIRQGVSKSKFMQRMQDLVIIIILSEAFSQLDNIWISASDLGSEGDFYWDSTGEFFGIFDDWIEGEPALGIENHHCAHMAIDKANSNNTHRWRNGNCYLLLRFVCESVPTATSLDSTIATKDKLQQTMEQVPLVNSFSHRNSYYEISTNKVRNF
jgi:hypothetical protein